MWKGLCAAAILAVSAGCAEIPPADPPVPTAAIARDWWVYFGHDSSAISAAGSATISNFAEYARQTVNPRITLTGHADRSGNPAYNMDLSVRRAAAIKKALVDQDISADSIEVKGRGETQPLVVTADGVKEPQNRRVEFTIQ